MEKIKLGIVGIGNMGSAHLSCIENGEVEDFPGDLEQRIRYTLTEDNAVVIDYRMVSDKETVINPTNHTYFNLKGHDSGTVLDHKLEIFADAFLPTDDTLIPTGEIRSVLGTPMDFRTPHTIGERIDADYLPLRQAGGERTAHDMKKEAAFAWKPSFFPMPAISPALPVLFLKPARHMKVKLVTNLH